MVLINKLEVDSKQVEECLCPGTDGCKHGCMHIHTDGQPENTMPPPAPSIGRGGINT